MEDMYNSLNQTIAKLSETSRSAEQRVSMQIAMSKANMSTITWASQYEHITWASQYEHHNMGITI